MSVSYTIDTPALKPGVKEEIEVALFELDSECEFYHDLDLCNAEIYGYETVTEFVLSNDTGKLDLDNIIEFAEWIAPYTKSGARITIISGENEVWYYYYEDGKMYTLSELLDRNNEQFNKALDFAWEQCFDHRLGGESLATRMFEAGVEYARKLI